MSPIIEKIKSWYANIKAGSISYKRRGMEPKKDWQVMLTVAFFVVLVLAVFAIYFYIQIYKGKFFVVAQDDKSVGTKINTSLLNKTVDDINARAQSLELINSQKIQYPDPAI